MPNDTLCHCQLNSETPVYNRKHDNQVYSTSLGAKQAFYNSVFVLRWHVKTSFHSTLCHQLVGYSKLTQVIRKYCFVIFFTNSI